MKKQSIPVLAIGWRFIAIAVLLLLATFAFQAFAQTEETETVNTPEETIVSEDSSLDVFVSDGEVLTPPSLHLLEGGVTEESEPIESSEPEVVLEEQPEEPIVTEESVVEEETQSAAVIESTPELTTDKDDYHPGETATIFGKFFAPLQTFLIKVFGSDDNNQNYTETEEEVTTDDEGEFTFSYLLDNFYRPFYEVVVSTLEGEEIAETWFRDGAVGTYDQCSNDDGDGYTTGDQGCRWINGNLQSNNSVYTEGDATVQRLWLRGYVPGSTHTVTLQYGTTKGGKRAYDFLTTWDHSENWITPTELCQGITGCTTETDDLLAIPHDSNGSGAYETPGRNFTMRGGDLTSATSPAIVSGTYAGDSETQITITFTVDSSGSMCDTKQGVTSCDVALFFGAHISRQIDWGTGNSAVNISGSPYHVALAAEDGTSIGQRDNQMQAGTIIVLGSITIVKDALPDDAQDFSFTTSGTGLSGFSLDDDANNALSNTQTFSGLAAGSYAVTEGQVAGWSLTDLVCVDPTTNSIVNVGTRTASINLAAGENITCTFTNTLQQGTLTLVKTVTNDNGGEAAVTDWTLSADGPTPISGTTGSGAVTSAPVDAGVYTLSESTGPDGYTAGTWSCPGATMNGNQVTVPAGQNVTCTINNNDNAPSLTLVKQVVNNNGGGAVPGDWTLTASGYDAQSPDAGNYNLSESGGPDGYTQTSLTCSDSGNTQVTSVTLSLGENVTCTFVNDDQQAHITVVKVVTNDDGGSAAPDDFDLTLEGNAVTSGVAVPVNPGTYTADETNLSGYTFEGYSGDCDTNGDVTVALGESKTCTLTNNDQQAYITVTKVVTNDNGGTAGPDDFDLTLEGAPVPSGVQVPVNPGTHTADETLLAGYSFSGYSGDCDSNGDVTVALGESKSCTLTNNDNAPSLTLVKEVTNDDGGDAIASEWTLTADGPTDISGAGGAVSGADFSAGTYALSESTGPTGYTAGAWNCVGGTQDGASITLAVGEQATCTIINDDQSGKLKVTKITNPASDTTTEFSITASAGVEGAVQGVATQSIVGGGTVEYTVDQGTYDVSEDDLAGWTETGNTCNDVVVPNGGEGSCTITNTKLASITIVKDAVPNDPQDFTFNNDFGEPHASTFSLDDDNTVALPNSRTFLVMPDTYSVTEDAVAGWEFDGATCTDGSPHTAIAVGAGEEVTCTFENQKLGTIVLIKNTLGGDGTFEFDLSGVSIPDTASLTTITGTDSETFTNVDPDNTYSILETTPTGWTQVSVSCVQSNDTVKNPASFTIASGQTVTCTFTNGKLPTLTLEKTVVNDHNGPATEASFTPSIDAVATTWDTPVTLAIGAHTASETTLDTYTAGAWGGQCAADGSVTLAYGDNKVCTITNDDKPGEIHGMKFNDENGNGTKDDGEVGLEDWTIFLDENDNDVLDGDEVSTETGADGHYSFTGLARGTYTVREQGQSGWYQTTPNPADIDLDNNEVVEDIDFGNYAIKALEVTKSARTSFTRTHNWTIEKLVDDSEVNLFEGDSQTVNYDVTVTKTGYTDSAWLVEGEITITNPNVPAGLVASVTNVADIVGALGAATVTCPDGLAQELSAGDELICTYTLSPEEGTNVTNTATVTTTGLVPGGGGTAPVVFGDPTTVIDDSINVTDTYEGALGETDTSTTFEYDRPLTCGSEEGEYEGLGNQVPNTATITETGADDSQTVTVNCYGLTVRKTANTSFTKTWNWDIDKTSTTSVLNLAPGQTYPVYYEVEVTASPTDSDWAVAGTITIVNPAPMPAVLSDVKDMLPANIEANVNCPALTVPANGSLECPYTASLPSAGDLINTAEVTTDNGTVYTGTANVSFVGATMTEIDESIEVTDDKYGPLGTVLASNAPHTFKYVQNIGPYESTTCGTTQQFDNTAELTTNDSGTAADDTVSVDVNVRCTCSLTQGYWKTHNDSFRGGAPADENWFNLPGAPSLGENTLFFGTGVTWYTTFWTAPKGNVYYNLAHQYMAAKLNVLNGAYGPTITADIAAAELLFNTYTPAQLQKLKGKTQVNVSKQFTDLAGKLAAFNEGKTNPAGHCSEIPQ